MSKRLEETKEAIQSWKHWGSWNDAQREVLEDILIYIKQAEQVEKIAEELGMWQDLHKEDTIKIDNQNKRYREAMEKACREVMIPNITRTKIYRELIEALESESDE